MYNHVERGLQFPSCSHERHWGASHYFVRPSIPIGQPYAHTASNSKEVPYSYNLSNTRRIVENAFGRLKARFCFIWEAFWMPNRISKLRAFCTCGSPRRTVWSDCGKMRQVLCTQSPLVPHRRPVTGGTNSGTPLPMAGRAHRLSPHYIQRNGKVQSSSVNPTYPFWSTKENLHQWFLVCLIFLL